MKRLISALLVFSLLTFVFMGCNKKGSLLDPSNPVTLNMCHVYGEQADSPMNRYVEEFNSTVGKEKGVIINVAFFSNASQIGEQLVKIQQGKTDVPSMPDLFFCHASNVLEIGVGNVLNWKKYFSADEIKDFVDSFVSDGTIGDSLAVLPVSKSTHLLFLAGGVFKRFSDATGVTYNDLATWDGFFDAAAKYYAYSGGKPFCAIDYVMRTAELDAISAGATEFYDGKGWYKDNEILLSSFRKFASSIAKGHIVVSNLYSNTQVMRGQTASGISSSAAVLYYNDVITYSPDNETEEMQLKVLPLPSSDGDKKYATQAGVGLCAYKTTEQKAEAATVFAKWFLEEKRNLDFVAQTGYMPVRNGAFDKLSGYTFKNDGFKATYLAMKTTRDTCVFLSEPSVKGYFPNTYALYNGIRKLQADLKNKYDSGKTADDITEEIVGLFRNTGK